jgi:hypothetical protein
MARYGLLAIVSGLRKRPTVRGPVERRDRISDHVCNADTCALNYRLLSHYFGSIIYANPFRRPAAGHRHADRFLHARQTGRRLGFDVVVTEYGCYAIDLAGSLAAAWMGMAEAGVQRAGDL